MKGPRKILRDDLMLVTEVYSPYEIWAYQVKSDIEESKLDKFILEKKTPIFEQRELPNR